MLEHLYFKATGNKAKLDGNYTNEYVKWLEGQLLDYMALNIN